MHHYFRCTCSPAAWEQPWASQKPGKHPSGRHRGRCVVGWMKHQRAAAAGRPEASARLGDCCSCGHRAGVLDGAGCDRARWCRRGIWTTKERGRGQTDAGGWRSCLWSRARQRPRAARPSAWGLGPGGGSESPRQEPSVLSVSSSPAPVPAHTCLRVTICTLLPEDSRRYTEATLLSRARHVKTNLQQLLAHQRARPKARPATRPSPYTLCCRP